jgi:hypothetical protein
LGSVPAPFSSADKLVQAAAIPEHSFALPLLPTFQQQSPSIKKSSEFPNKGIQQHQISAKMMG